MDEKYIFQYEDDYLSSDYLEHYGVKGMKWGVRKAVETVGSGARKAGSIAKKAGSSAIGYVKSKTGNAQARIMDTSKFTTKSGSRTAASKGLITTVAGTIGGKKVKKISPYNSWSSRTKRKFKSFKSNVHNWAHGGGQKKKLSSLTNQYSFSNNKKISSNKASSLLTTVGKAPAPKKKMSNGEMALFNVLSDMTARAAYSAKNKPKTTTTSKITPDVFNQIDALNVDLLKKNAKRLGF